MSKCYCGRLNRRMCEFFDTPICHERTGDLAFYTINLIEVSRIIPTESHSPEIVNELVRRVEKMEVWTSAILLERQTLNVMDGHHRLAAARQIGLKSVPAVLLDYLDTRLALTTWDSNLQITPSEIATAGETGNLLPYKTTRHILNPALPALYMPLSLLRRDVCVACSEANE